VSALYTVAYPELNADDEAFVEAFRTIHDPRGHSLIRAHFTLVSPCDAVPLDTYVAHVASIAVHSQAIRFVCRKAAVGPGDAPGWGSVYLVPDEGCVELLLLHDRLYSGILEPHLRSKPSFVPHVTMAAGLDRADAKRLCAGLNAREFEIAGWVAALQVGSIDDGAFVHHGNFELRRPRE
jgi:2'-5' RNA ligase